MREGEGYVKEEWRQEKPKNPASAKDRETSCDQNGSLEQQITNYSVVNEVRDMKSAPMKQRQPQDQVGSRRGTAKSTKGQRKTSECRPGISVGVGNGNAHGQSRSKKEKLYCSRLVPGSSLYGYWQQVGHPRWKLLLPICLDLLENRRTQWHDARAPNS